jgi:hypothetical protein
MYFFGGASWPKEPYGRLLSGFCHAVDKAVREYTAAEALTARYVDGGEFQLFSEALGRFESCIGAVKRALRLLDRMERSIERRGAPRDLRRLLRSRDAVVTPLRDAIEHIDADIAGTRLRHGEPHILDFTRDGHGLEIGRHKLRLDQLRGTIINLVEAGKLILSGPGG